MADRLMGDGMMRAMVAVAEIFLSTPAPHRILSYYAGAAVIATLGIRGGGYGPPNPQVYCQWVKEIVKRASGVG